jgi:plastocyanin
MIHRRIAVAVAATALVVPTTAALAATRSVSVKDDFFSSKRLTVSKGTTVRWTWKGKAPHNVTAVKGPVRFRSSTKTSGSFKHTFKKTGTYQLLCTVHAPDMEMTVVVR